MGRFLTGIILLSMLFWATDTPRCAEGKSTAKSSSNAAQKIERAKSKCAPISRRTKGKIRQGSRLFGVVQVVDHDEHLVSVKDRKDKLWKFLVAEDTELTRGGDYELISFSDITVRDRVHFLVEGDVARCVHINVYLPRKTRGRKKEPSFPPKQKLQQPEPRDEEPGQGISENGDLDMEEEPQYQEEEPQYQEEESQYQEEESQPASDDE